MNQVTIERWRLAALACLAGTLLLPSCGKGNPDERIPREYTDTTQVIFYPGVPEQTRMSGINYARDEQPVLRWACFVFDGNGKLVFSQRVNGESPVGETLKTGQYRLFAIANYPADEGPTLDAICTSAGLEALEARLGDNSRGALQMAGSTASGSFTVSATGSPIPVNIHLQRLVAKITLGSVSRCFDQPLQAQKSLILKHIYLTNVYTETRYVSDYSYWEMSRQPSDWYNAMGWHGSGSMAPSSATDALVGDRSLDISLKQNAYMAVNHSLYCFPNPTASERDSRAPDWCVRRTRLILETELDGVTGYYQATIPTPERNAHYVVHCTLRKPGSAHPEQEGPDTMDVRIAVAEEDWDHDYAVTENA